ADYTTPPPVFAGSGKVYILRTSDGRHAALRLKSYVGATGTKGQLTIEVLYPYE
ncbi:HmuY family protein, partial [Acinetobacter pittii]|uniref:HmuY family protein n=1 Tax=Acinetobacter pittii TaxID=48296 RepID=UPI0035BE7CDA